MNLRAASLAIAAGLFLFVGACGGGSESDGGSSASPPNTPTSDNGNTGGTPASSCQAHTPTTIVGGDLAVAAQGPVGVTLLSNGGLIQYTFTFLYDNVFGIPTNNRQDKWGSESLFPPGTPVGTSTQVELQPFRGFVN